MRANMHMHHAAAALQLLLHCLPPQALSLSTTTDAGAVYADGEPIFPITLYAETQTIAWEPAAVRGWVW